MQLCFCAILYNSAYSVQHTVCNCVLCNIVQLCNISLAWQGLTSAIQLRRMDMPSIEYPVQCSMYIEHPVQCILSTVCSVQCMVQCIEQEMDMHSINSKLHHNSSILSPPPPSWALSPSQLSMIMMDMNIRSPCSFPIHHLSPNIFFQVS